MSGDSHHWLDDQFDLEREHPLFWWVKAASLLRAAELCWDHYSAARVDFQKDPERYVREKKGFVDDLHLVHVYFLVSGMAIEGFLKGIVVARNTDLFADGSKERRLYSHDLVDLAQWAGVDIDADARFLLKQLEGAVVWHGRYPTPRNKNDWSRWRDEHGRRISPGSMAPDRQPHVDALLARLLDEIAKLRAKD